MHRLRADKGFTLIELLVVISIIVVLMAIIFPAFQSAREKARQTRCISNMHSIDIALKSYLQDYRYFPPPPAYDVTLQKYTGGPAALYPDYIQSHETFVCADDRKIDGVQQAARAANYCSYAGVADNPQAGEWDFLLLDGTSAGGADQSQPRQRLYNWGGYALEAMAGDPLGRNDAFDDCIFDATAMPPKWVLGHDDPRVAGTSVPTWLSGQGMGWKNYPRLQNRRAPDNTIIFRCISHRDFYKVGDETDVVMRLGGDATTVKISDMQTPDSTGAAPWVSQQH